MSNSFAAFLEENKAPHILCIGDIMLDRFVYGRVDRISPEAPIPVIRTEREIVMLGGCGNVVRNVAELEAHVTIIGAIGNDSAGAECAAHVTALKNASTGLIIDETRPTTLKVRYVAGSQQMLRADSEINKPLSPEMEEKIIAEIQKAIPSTDIVILSDYAKGVLTSRVVKETIAAATKAGKRILVDPKGRDLARYHGATLITPNRQEMGEIVGYPIDSVETAEKAARALIAEHAFAGVLVKLGSDGVCLVMKDQPSQHYQATAREVFDVSGAGDTVVATLAVAMACDLTPEDSALLANAAGSVVVGKVGTAVVSRAEIAREIRQTRMNPLEDKIMTWEQAATKADQWRAQGLNVGFTNGCFDLIHPGHIASIRQAHENCDKLIIGLNTDESVQRLKGPTRPVQNEMSRATVLAALMDVDAVILFGEPTPLELIKTVRPTVLVKGQDYTVETVVGAKEVMSWGGKVVLAKLVEGQSTTNLINRSNT